MPTSNARLRRQRERLHAEDAHCHYCGIVTELVNREGQARIVLPIEHDEATIEHLHPRGHPERGKHGGEATHVLSCWQCNNDRCNDHNPQYMIDQIAAIQRRLNEDEQFQETPAQCYVDAVSDRA